MKCYTQTSANLTAFKGAPWRTHWTHVHPKEISDKNFWWSQLAQPLF